MWPSARARAPENISRARSNANIIKRRCRRCRRRRRRRASVCGCLCVCVFAPSLSGVIDAIAPHARARVRSGLCETATRRKLYAVLRWPRIRVLYLHLRRRRRRLATVLLFCARKRRKPNEAPTAPTSLIRRPGRFVGRVHSPRIGQCSSRLVSTRPPKTLPTQPLAVVFFGASRAIIMRWRMGDACK